MIRQGKALDHEIIQNSVDNHTKQIIHTTYCNANTKYFDLQYNGCIQLWN